MTAYDQTIDVLNHIVATLGGTTSHDQNLAAFNDILTILGKTAGYDDSLAAVNAWIVGLGGSGGYDTILEAINEASRLYGGSTGFDTTLDALNALADVVSVLGPELVTNGNFDSTTTGWSASTATLSVVSGALRVLGTSGGQGRASQSIVTETGKTYRLTAAAPSAGASRIRAGTTVGGFDLLNITPSGAVSADFVAAGVSTSISLVDADAGGAIDFPSVSVRRVLVT